MGGVIVCMPEQCPSADLCRTNILLTSHMSHAVSVFYHRRPVFK